MPRQKSKARGSSAKPPAKSQKGAALKGGIGGEVAGKEGRYELSRPGLTESLRKRMVKSSGDTREQLAESLLAAARQHMQVPDDGSRVWGKAFQSLMQSDQDAVLSALTPEDQSVVRQAFTDIVEADPTPEARAPRTREEKIKAVARKALEESNAQPTVNLDAPSEAEPKRKSVFSKGLIEYEDKVVNQPGPEWTKGQSQRGFRLLTIAPSKPGAAPRYIREVLPNVLEAEQAAATPQPISPAAGKAVTTPSRRASDANVQTIDRLTPTSFDELDEQTRIAAVEGTRIYDQIEELESIFDEAKLRNAPGTEDYAEFLDTPQGQKLQQQFTQIVSRHPKAVEFIEDPSLQTRPMPRDVVQESEPGLPKEMKLSWHLGGTEGQRAVRWSDRPDRRTQFNIPADAPNRRGWLQAITEVVGESVDPATGKRVVKRRLRQGDPALEGGVGAVQLPYPTNLIGESKAVKAAREDLEFDPRGLYGDRASSKPLDQADISVTDEDIAEALRESEAFEDYDGMGAPAEDQTMLAESWSKPKQAEVLRYGTAEGSARDVKADRDYALREGKSARDKLAEKLFRAAQQFGDIDTVASDRRSVGTVGNFQFANPESFGEDYLSRKLEGGSVRKKATATPTREFADNQLLKLDGLMPVWRGYIEDVQDGQVVLRRPNAEEIAGFLVDQAGLPDPSIASRLTPLVQASMDAYEAQTPTKAKALRAMGRHFPSGPKKAKYLDQLLSEQRIAGDTRPRYSDEAQRLISESQARLADDGWSADTGESTSGGFVAEQASAEPAAALPVDPSAVAAFGRKAGAAPSGGGTSKAGKGGKPPTNIAGLVAMLTGLGAGAGASGDAQAGDQPPLELLAMARQRSASRITGRAASAQPAAGRKPPVQQTQQQGKKPAAGKPKPKPAAKPAPNQQQAQASAQPQTVVNQPAPQPQPTTPPRPAMFAKSPTMNFLRGMAPVASGAAGYIPDLAALGGAVGLGAVVGPPIVNAYRSMFSGSQPQQPANEPAGFDPFEAARQQMLLQQQQQNPAPPMQPKPSAPLDNSTSRIMALRQMLG